MEFLSILKNFMDPLSLSKIVKDDKLFLYLSFGSNSLIFFGT